MVASLNQSPLLTLDALSSCGVVLPTEARAALDTSLTLKARELGVQAFLLWGKFTTSSGRDYYIARAYNGTKRVEGKVIVNPGNKFYYSTDCAEWLDLEPVDGKLGELCGLIDGACMIDTSVRDMQFIQFPASRASTCTTIVTSSRVTAPDGGFLPPRAEFGNPRREESREPLPRDLFISHSNTSTLTLHPTLYPDKQASDGSRATPRTSTPSRSSPRRQPRTQRLAKKPRRPTQSNTPW